MSRWSQCASNGRSSMYWAAQSQCCEIQYGRVHAISTICCDGSRYPQDRGTKWVRSEQEYQHNNNVPGDTEHTYQNRV